MSSLLANVPIPESFVAGLFVGGAAHALAPRRLSQRSWPLRAAGLAVLPAGLVLIAWAVVAARDVRIDRPVRLITHGPYAAGRNPMYLGWALSSLGLSLLANSLWLAAATLAAGLYLHAVEIPKEELSLLDQFGEEYRAYRRQTPRYL